MIVITKTQKKHYNLLVNISVKTRKVCKDFFSIKILIFPLVLYNK